MTETGASGPDRGPTGAAAAPPDPLVDEGLAVLEQIERELAEVDAALIRLDQGTYGTCRVCAGAIDDEVLAERPTTDLCGDHVATPSS